MLAILLKMDFFSGSSMFRSEKRIQNVPKQKQRSGEECYFDTDLPGNKRYQNLDKAEEPDKIQKDPEGKKNSHNSLPLLFSTQS